MTTERFHRSCVMAGFQARPRHLHSWLSAPSYATVLPCPPSASAPLSSPCPPKPPSASSKTQRERSPGSPRDLADALRINRREAEQALAFLQAQGYVQPARQRGSAHSAGQ